MQLSEEGVVGEGVEVHDDGIALICSGDRVQAVGPEEEVRGLFLGDMYEWSCLGSVFAHRVEETSALHNV